MRCQATLIAVVALAVGLPAVAAAQGPTFDCAKAQGQVEKLICADADLAARDRKLDEVYKAAVAKARDGLLNDLRAEQRGWVKGRNECWKASGDAPAFLTASWQATTVRACVEGQYRLRTSELQAVWQILPPQTVTFACQDNPANAIVASFFDADPPSARLERGDTTVTVWRVESASGAKYEGQNVTFWNQGAEAMVTWLNVNTGETEELKCRVR